MQYTNTFHQMYSRSHRNSEVNCLHCFPTCGSGGHKPNASCGNRVRVHAARQHVSAPTMADDVFCGHIRQIQNTHQFKKGQMVCFKRIQSQLNLPPWDTKRLTAGVCTGEKGSIEFTPEFTALSSSVRCSGGVWNAVPELRRRFGL